jgi:hypothetical protein
MGLMILWSIGTLVIRITPVIRAKRFVASGLANKGKEIPLVTIAHGAMRSNLEQYVQSTITLYGETT